VAGAFAGYCDDGFVWVPGSAKYGTMPGFCVQSRKARFDADLGGLMQTDAEAEYPTWVNVSQGEAQLACQDLGESYHLISENEWLTIAENIIRVGENDIDENTAGLQLATSTLISGEGNPFILTNDNIIYNLAGDIGEWTEQTITKAGVPELIGVDEWQEYYDVLDYKGYNIAPAYYLTDEDNNIGLIKVGNSSNNLRGFVRGYNGIYSLDLSNPPTMATSAIGFRCAR